MVHYYLSVKEVLMEMRSSRQHEEFLREQGIGQRANRLSREKSPYLLQHAHNPVDWYPWGEEAFEKAKKEDKPVFLSIGYSTCHWCHVMEHESFEDHEVAKAMNDAFVCVKVDREERPDLDNLYMDVCQMFTGRGGWPLNIIMSPDKKPFFAATYIPKETRFGVIGMLELAPMMKNSWLNQRERLMVSAEQCVDILRHRTPGQTGKEPDAGLLDSAYKELEQRFDSLNGGFGSAPKFASAHILFFLLRYYKRTGNLNALRMVEKTLQSIRHGGVYDHIGFGFHRYATDAQWILPHFEKMLYDQAMLATAYTEAYQATGNEEYRKTAREVLAYVMRDMTSPKGGFYSAEDADSEGVEGRFYLWTLKEIENAVGTNDLDFIKRALNIEESGNFFDQTTGEKTGMNILYPGRPSTRIAFEMHMSERELLQSLELLRQRLFLARQKRIRPQKDDKILTDWNGMMIAGLAKAAGVFDEKIYADAAVKAVHFILGNMRNRDGRLFHRYRYGEAAIPAYLNDYAFLIWGLIELYEATFDAKYLKTALELNNDMIDRFLDKENSGFYLTPDDAEPLPVRRKEIHDSAVPSGNAVAMMNLLRLSRITGDAGLEKIAVEIARAFSADIAQLPSAFTQLLCALDFALGPSYEVVITGSKGSADTAAMLKALRDRFIPDKIVLLSDPKEHDGITDIAPFVHYQVSVGGRATAHVCRDYHCEHPTTNPDRMLELLNIRNVSP